MGSISWALVYNAPTSASAADAITFLITLASTKIGPLNWVRDLLPRKRYPPSLLLASGHTKYAASLSPYNIISLCL